MISTEEAKEKWQELKQKYPELIDFEVLKKAFVSFDEDCFKGLVPLCLEAKRRLMSLREAIEAWLTPGTFVQMHESKFLADKKEELIDFLIEVQKEIIKATEACFEAVNGSRDVEKVNEIIKRLAEFNEEYLAYLKILPGKWEEARKSKEEVHYQW